MVINKKREQDRSSNVYLNRIFFFKTGKDLLTCKCFWEKSCRKGYFENTSMITERGVINRMRSPGGKSRPGG